MTTKVEIEGTPSVRLAHAPAHGKGAAPWITWGNSLPFRMVGIPLGASITAQQQLVNLNYGRPDSFRFFLAAKLLRYVTALGVPAALPVALQVEFEFAIGNGFTSFTDSFFQTLEFGAGAVAGDTRVCTSIERPPANTASTAPNILEVLPAQTLYIAARGVSAGSINAGAELQFLATAFVAPQVHVRPGWWLDNFVGKEETF